MIVTLTTNPAIDRTFAVDRLAFEDRAYILEKNESAGGRGINAACVLHAFGAHARAILPCGGKAGERLQKLLGCCGFETVFVPIARNIRTNLTITDKHGLTVNLNEAGPALSSAEVERLEKAVGESLEGAQWLMLCGSLPPGVPPDFYARLITAARRAGVKTLLHTSADALREGIEAHPTVVTPNQQEAGRLLNRALITRSHFLDAAARIREMGAETVVLSLGSRGAIAASAGGMLEAIPPRIDAVCPIGSGDALSAAYAWSMVRDGNGEDAVRWGVAEGTASALLPGMRLASRPQAEAVYRQVEVRRAE